MPPEYVAVAIKTMYEPAGVHTPLDGITTEKRTYDATAIAKKYGVYSKNGNPHNLAIGIIADILGIGDEHKILVPFQHKNGHSGATIQYDDYAVALITAWIERQGNPTAIDYNGKRYNLRYSK